MSIAYVDLFHAFHIIAIMLSSLWIIFDANAEMLSVGPLPDMHTKLFPKLLHTIDTLPEQVHISLGDSEKSIVIMWATFEESEGGSSFVHYGIAPGNFSMKEAAEMEEFQYGNPEGCKAHYRAVLKNLQSLQMYYYRVETDGHFSREFQFRHPDSEVNRSSSFIMYGDLGKVGGGYTMKRLKWEALHGQHDLIIHAGDFAYNFHDEGGARGDAFMNRIEPIASMLPYMVCPGNHELYYDFYHYRYRFSVPGTPWPIPKHKMWYSFDIALVHFIAYTSEAYYTDNGAYVANQYGWLTDDLAAANRNRAQRPWIIAFGHRPMYCSNLNSDDCTTQTSAPRREPYNLERLFYEQGVDLILQAHEHSYERFYPLYNGIVTECSYVNPSAPVHIITGAAGCNERETMCADVLLNDAAEWSAKRSWLPGLNGYGRFRIPNATHLHWEQVLSVSGQALDELWIIQNNHGPRNPVQRLKHRAHCHPYQSNTLN